jgi:hypothetical protein
MYPIWATKLGDESLQDGVGRCGCFFIGDRHGCDKFGKAVLHCANIDAAFVAAWQGPHEVDVEDLSGETVFPGFVYCVALFYLCFLSQAMLAAFDFSF